MEIKELVNKVKEIKEFKNTKAEYIAIKNKINEIESIERECKQEILNNNIFNMNEESYRMRSRRNPNLQQRITEVNEDCTMSKEDMEKYLKMLHEARMQKGIQAKDWNTSSTYKMFEEMKKIENKLVNMITELAPVEIKEKIVELFASWKYRGQAIEIMISVE